MGYFFGKFIVVLFYSIVFMLITAGASVLAGVLSGYIAWEWSSIFFLLRKCMEISSLTAFSVLPVLAVAASQKGYILPVCVTLIYTFFGFYSADGKYVSPSSIQHNSNRHAGCSGGSVDAGTQHWGSSDLYWNMGCCFSSIRKHYVTQKKVRWSK